ncbi:helix-turn-helix transcriptional regulator [Tepidibacillus infernus]|uniref:XRE family transcriptional regulator n=1 Tax=Tepidibacillus decaturensis TaxID=1413211 RepID=A0A135L4W9_9BACI|nr:MULTISPECIES: helix-turn-helix transcriptional regulator [Tepidibacillus]KXG43957.1 XRE family transcriptional regulator [Tepidibacillus decaturensis]GBF12404.1 anaerobic benzoate catabolism transcriptional regulator [Tepidibacillus sp. HK-1]
MDVQIIFGKVLKNLRVNRKISQEELAFRSKLDRTYISLLERGKRKPSLNTIYALSKALSIKPSELIREVENEYQLDDE